MNKPTGARSKRKRSARDSRPESDAAVSAAAPPSLDTAPPASARPSAWRRWIKRLPAVFLIVMMIGALIVGSVSRPLEVLWRQSRAREALRNNDDERALALLREVLRLDVNNPETLYLLARVHRRLGNADKSGLLLRQAAIAGTDPTRIVLEERLMHAQTGQLSQVESYLPEMLVQGGDDGPDICQAYVQGYMTNLRSENAMQLLDAWEQSFPRDPQPMFMRAYLLQNMGHPEQAIPLYRQGLGLAPGRTKMRRMLGECLLATDQLDEASKELELCAEQAPLDGKVRFAQAQISHTLRDPESALRQLREAVTLDPNDTEALRFKGQVNLEVGQLDQAMDDLQTVVQREPYNAIAREALGRTLMALGRTEEAKEHLDYVAKAESRMREVDRLIRDVIERPGDVAMRFEIASILFEYDSPESAARWMLGVLEIDPNHVAAHQALAAFYESREDSIKAMLHRQRAQDLSGGAGAGVPPLDVPPSLSAPPSALSPTPLPQSASPPSPAGEQ